MDCIGRTAPSFCSCAAGVLGYGRGPEGGNLHGPHLDHGPLDVATTLLADVRLSVPVAFYLQIEDSIHSLIVSSLCLLSTPCNIARLLSYDPNNFIEG